MKTWSPDTCGCTIEEIYDGTNIIGGGQVIKKCTAHQSVPDDQLYGVLYSNPDGENKRKNRVDGYLRQNFQGVLSEIINNPDGSTTLNYKKGITVSWLWGGEGVDRVLQVSITGTTLNQNQKNLIISYAESLFGVGKLIIL